MIQDVLEILGDPTTIARKPLVRIEKATDRATIAAYRALRTTVFVQEQNLFAENDLDEHDDDPRLVVLVARDRAGTVVGGVRLGPATEPDLGWWFGGRLVVDRNAAAGHGIGSQLVRAACAYAETAGALRFEATVQNRNVPLFTRLGWQSIRPAATTPATTTPAATTPPAATSIPHTLMRWPIDRIAALAAATKNDLGPLVHGLAGSAGFVGDDGVPVPGSDLVAACDAILPSMVERDPEWAGWCAVLVNVNDLAAMGATPVALLDALGARDRSFAARVLAGLRRASTAFGAPILGGHTQFGVPASLSVTALGRTADPVPSGGGRPGQRVRLTADLGGSWRPGYTGRQWDSTSTRTPAELAAMLGAVGCARPAAAKDVSMAGVVGTLGMLAEASGCGAVLDIAQVPKPADASVGDWLTCFPGFGMLTADEPGRPALPAGPALGAECGELVAGTGVALRWPDGEVTDAIAAGVTGLGRA